jgi:polysaccharide export outer membrane protein
MFDLSKPTEEEAAALGPGDLVDLKFFNAPELNDLQKVAPDGTLTLQLVGSVNVQGKTPDQVKQELVKMYEPRLKNPEITVILRSQESRKVSVMGEVFRPGIVLMNDHLTVLEALTYAGGYRPDSAQIANVIIIRRQGNTALVGSVDLRPSLGLEPPENEELVRPLYLRPGDVVYVPETRIVRLDRWIDQHINRIVPITGFTIVTTNGSTSVGYDTRP